MRRNLFGQPLGPRNGSYKPPAYPRTPPVLRRNLFGELVAKTEKRWETSENEQARSVAREIFRDSGVAFQRAIGDAYGQIVGGEPYKDLSEAYVRAIRREQAEGLVLRYEWLGALGQAHLYYGLHIADSLIGCAVFGFPAGMESREICGEDLRRRAICLTRGCSTHLAPKNAASFLISRACRLAHEEHGYSIFFAYADMAAGEIGNVYQAANWFYIGQNVGRWGKTREEFVLPNGRQVTDRYLRSCRLTIPEALALGWRRMLMVPKHKYVWFEGNRRERRLLKAKCKYPFLPYPKRDL